jgi:hypothetical protein
LAGIHIVFQLQPCFMVRGVVWQFGRKGFSKQTGGSFPGMIVSGAEAADIIDHMINGTLACGDWDDLLDVTRYEDSDPTIRKVAAECGCLYSKYLPGSAGGWCNTDGVDRLRQLRDILRSGQDYA